MSKRLINLKNTMLKLFLILIFGYFYIQPVKAMKEVTLGWSVWSDTEVLAKLAKKAIKSEMGICLKLDVDTPENHFQKLLNGKIDIMFMAWIPSEQEKYFNAHSQNITKLGVLYSGVQFRFAVPSYIPKDAIGSLSDLKKPDIKERLNGMIHVDDLRPNVEESIKKTISEYDLDDYKYIPAVSESVYTSLEHHVRRNHWIVVSAWSPHWIFSKWDLRVLEDPKNTHKNKKLVYAIGHKDINTRLPEIASFFSRMQIPVLELEELMYKAKETTFDQAVSEYIEKNPKRIKYWVTGKMN